MTMISSFHTLNRSLGLALLIASGGKSMAAFFIGGEIVLYLAYKIARGDFLYFFRVEGVMAIVSSFWTRSLVKIIADFTGCLHFRHPVSVRAN